MSNNVESASKVEGSKYQNTPNVYRHQGPVNNIDQLHGTVSNVTNVNISNELDPICFGFDISDAFFTGRSDELKQLKDATIDHQSVYGQKPPIVVISGLGGIGKTQLARKFIDENRLHYTNVIWINSNVHSTMLDEFTKLAKNDLKISTKDKDFKSLVKEAFNKLSASPTVIVFDNIDEMKNTEIIKIVLTMGTSGTRPHVVITSRIKEWSDSIHSIQLKKFNEVDAVAYVSKKLKKEHNESDEEKTRLVVKLQYFPLALVQATAYINHHRARDDTFHISNYIREFDLFREKVLDSKFFHNETNLYEETTLTTWKVTIAAIKKCETTGDLAIRILRIIAYFDPDNIRRDIFFNLKYSLSEPNPNFEDEVISAVGLLVNYSMVDGHRSESVLSIHGLVQEVTRIELEIVPKSRKTILGEALHVISEMKEHSHFKECLDHGISVFLASLTCKDLVVEYKKFPAIIIRNLNKYCKYIRGVSFGVEILDDLIEILGENDLDAIECQFKVAVSHFYLGKYNDALQLFLAVHKKRKEIFGGESSLTLDCLSNIASIYVRMGKHNEALLMKQEILEQRKKIFGENDLDTLKLKYNVAVSYSRMGRFSEALLINQEVLKIMKPELGECDRDTLRVESNIGCLYDSLGEYSNALEIHLSVWQKRKTTLTEDHTEILNSMSHIALTYNNLGKYLEALKMYQAVFDKRKAILLEDHPKTLDTKSSIAITYNHLGEYSKALEIHEAVNEHLKKIFDEDHLSTVHSVSDIAETLSYLGRYAEARQKFEAVFEKLKSLQDEDHLLTVNSLSNVGVSYSNMGEHSAAMEIHRKVFDKYKTILGENHPHALTIKFNIAASHSNMAEHSVAMQMHQDVFDQRKKILGEYHPHTLESKFCIAISHNNLGNYSVALRIHQEVYDTRIIILGEDHPDTLNSMSNIADSYSNIGNIYKALQMHQDVLDKRKNIFGENHPKVLGSTSNVAAAYSFLGKYSKALLLYQQVYENHKTVLGDHHPLTLHSALLIRLCTKDMKACDCCTIL